MRGVPAFAVFILIPQACWAANTTNTTITTAAPIPQPSSAPKLVPTPYESLPPTVLPSVSKDPTPSPTASPVPQPTAYPTNTHAPSVSSKPTPMPTYLSQLRQAKAVCNRFDLEAEEFRAKLRQLQASPSEAPTHLPSSLIPTSSLLPSPLPSAQPTHVPTGSFRPSPLPTKSNEPTVTPPPTVTTKPSLAPTPSPTETGAPSIPPVPNPTSQPSPQPTSTPAPSMLPTPEPTSTYRPSPRPSMTTQPTLSRRPTPEPSLTPAPTVLPSHSPTVSPTTPEPTRTSDPTASPSISSHPTEQPTLRPSAPTPQPTQLQRYGETAVLAGQRKSGNADGIGEEASFKQPWGFALRPGTSSTDPATSAVVFDTGNNLVRTLDLATQEVKHLAGDGGHVNKDGVGAEASIYNPKAGAVLAHAGGHFLAYMPHRNDHIRTVNLTDGNVRSLTGETAAGDRYGYQDGAFVDARFRSPAALTLSPDGNTAYVADTTNGFIRVLDLVAETVSTLCGCCGSSVTADNLGHADGVGSSAKFNLPQGLAMSADGITLYVADTGNNKVRMVDVASGTVSTFGSGVNNTFTTVDNRGRVLSTSSTFGTPIGLAATSSGKGLYVGGAYVVDYVNMTGTTPTVQRVAGSGQGGSEDGVGTAASFGKAVTQLALDPYDKTTLYAVDQANHKIRTIRVWESNVYAHPSPSPSLKPTYSHPPTLVP